MGHAVANEVCLSVKQPLPSGSPLTMPLSMTDSILNTPSREALTQLIVQLFSLPTPNSLLSFPESC